MEKKILSNKMQIGCKSVFENYWPKISTVMPFDSAFKNIFSNSLAPYLSTNALK